MATSYKLFIGGLSYNSDSHSLRDYFQSFGQVKDAVVITDRETGSSRGFGFVTYDQEEEATKAVTEANGTNLDGRTIRVDRASGGRREGNDRSGGGGGYRGGRGGGGGGGYRGGDRSSSYSGGGGGGGNNGGNYRSSSGYGDRDRSDRGSYSRGGGRSGGFGGGDRNGGGGGGSGGGYRNRGGHDEM